MSGADGARTVRLGNIVFTTSKAVNVATMGAFKEALEAEYGVFGTQAFDTVLGTRNQLGLSLRVHDIAKTLSHLDHVKRQRWGSELNRHRSHPVLLEKLKTNGVEPGFIYRNDWSPDDTRNFMADIWSPANQASLDEFVDQTPSLRAKRDGNPPATRQLTEAPRACAVHARYFEHGCKSSATIVS